MDAFFENAQKIFDVARADESGESNDFALLIRPDGGLHFVMESPLDSATALDAAATNAGARIAYRVTRNGKGGVRVAGRSGDQECVLERRVPGQHEGLRNARQFSAELLRDQPLYRINSPLTLSAAS